MTGPSLLEVDGLSVAYQLRSGRLQALSGVSLTLSRGEALGVVGESACGKTTLAQALLRILPENGEVTAGTVRLDGALISSMADEAFRTQIRWKRIAMVFQGAMNSLDPVRQVSSQLSRVARLHSPGLSGSQLRELAAALLRLVGLPDATADRYPHELSGGMRQRVVIAMSLVADPDIMIADEATTALDVVVQAQILAELVALQRARGLALLVISHDLDVIAQVCDRIAVMYAGEVVETGPAKAVLTSPQHPYTAALLASLPRLRGPRHRLAVLPGSPPDLAEAIDGCRFAPRCPLVAPICVTLEPQLAGPDPARQARCHFRGDARIHSIFGRSAS